MNRSLRRSRRPPMPCFTILGWGLTAEYAQRLATNLITTSSGALNRVMAGLRPAAPPALPGVTLPVALEKAIVEPRVSQPTRAATITPTSWVICSHPSLT